jgi:hypothetical protein
MSDRTTAGPGPSFLGRAPLPLVETPPPAELEARLVVPNQNSYLRTYRLGDCTVIVTREGGIFHLSIAQARRPPTWDEVAEAWYRCVPGAAHRHGGLVLPPLEEYVNLHEFCFQVTELLTAPAEVPAP